jgi:hypothetical protein
LGEECGEGLGHGGAIGGAEEVFKGIHEDDEWSMSFFLKGEVG